MDSVAFNKALIRPVHRSLTVNNTLSSLANEIYIMLLDANSSYHNLKWDKKSSYFTSVLLQFGKRLPFKATPAVDMFQRNINKIFKELPIVFGIADNMLLIGYEGDDADHNRTIRVVLKT